MANDVTFRIKALWYPNDRMYRVFIFSAYDCPELRGWMTKAEWEAFKSLLTKSAKADFVIEEE